MNVQASPASLRGWSEAEWQVRCELAALYRLCAYHRWTDSIFTHISARVPGPEHHFLLNRFGQMHHEVRASDLVKIDIDGNPVEEADPRTSDPDAQLVNKAGFVIHSAVHMAREDAHFVIHTHTPAGIAVSTQKQGLLPLSQQALKYYNNIAYHGYEGIALDEDERVRLVADLGSYNAMLLRNHGILVVGSTAAFAYDELYTLERACAAQVATLAGGCELIFPPKEVCERTAAQFRSPMIRKSCDKQWEAALRLIEGGTDYRS
jgi:ribulose-5-phosphate 4-epimerase/fuculose-1-phosphate aldolase